MFELLSDGNGKIVGVHATGRLTDADYQNFLPILEERIDKYGHVSVLVDMEGFEGWDLLAAWDDFTFGMTHWHHFDRLALVGDKTWEKLSAKTMNILMRGEVRFFELKDLNEAWDWIKSPEVRH